MALALLTITNSIAAISVTNVTILDADQIPLEPDSRASYLFPKPNGFLTGFSLTRNSQGQRTALMTVEYDLHYTFCGFRIGKGRMLEIYAEMVTRVMAIIDAALALDGLTGAVEFDPQDIPDFGVINDPAGNAWHGCEITFHIMEFVN